MLNKPSLPSAGFILCVLTLGLVLLFGSWALGPLPLERAKIAEQLGHELGSQGRNKEASRQFLIAAQIEDDAVSTSRRYRCAGTTSTTDSDKIKYYRLALKYNPDNVNARTALDMLLK
jgi:hypothetical protein